MKRLFAAAALSVSALIPLSSNASFNPIQQDDQYTVRVDLKNVVDDQVKVEIVVPLIRENEAIYNMPSMVPGTYKVYDFGRFVNDFVAIGGRGDTLEVEQLNTNQWKIKSAKKLYKIVYWADDTYDSKGDDIFAPAGTNFDASVSLLNNFSFLGYLEGKKDVKYTYEVIKPSEFTGSTSLDMRSDSDTLDVFTAHDYFELHDCPVLYAGPERVTKYIGDTEILIASYSPKGNLKAEKIMEEVLPVFEAANTYLGGDLPADKYTVLIYGMDLKQSMLGVGALEHHTSTVVNVPDISDQYLKMIADESMMQLLRDIISHEFFHIVTPLNIHSQHIADYDFMNPQMSKHLWLYEGVTEYNANISQVRAGVLTEEQFMDNMKSKMVSDRQQFNPHVPFTVSSTYALSYYEDQYANVYQKGALIGMCLDLLLREESEGEYGLANLLMELSTTYGKDTFFLDDELFDIISAQVESERVREFFARYVESAEPLPYKELLANVGYEYESEKVTRTITDGDVVFKVMDGDVIVATLNTGDPMIRQLGLKSRDVVMTINDEKITESNYQEVFDALFANGEVGKEFTMVIKRNNGKKMVKQKLNGVVQEKSAKEKDYLMPKENASSEQLSLKKAWLNN